MNDFKDLQFDLFLSGLKAQNQQNIFGVLVAETSQLCGVDKAALAECFSHRLEDESFGMGEGVAIFDIKLSMIKTPVLVMSTFEQAIDFNAPDDNPVDIMAALLSPQSCGPLHLQRLALVSRILRSSELCAALRDARNADAMKVLFMPSQDWMIAA